jgi:hypothetical protein
MFGFALNLIDSVNIKGAFFPNYGGYRFGDNPQFCLCVTGMSFDFKPNLELAFLRPDGTHFRPGISRDHNSNTFCVKWRLVVPLRCAKSQRITSRCGYFARGIYMLIRRLVGAALMRVAQNPAVQKKAGEVAGKALDVARPSLLRASRKAGELTRKAAKKISDDC